MTLGARLRELLAPEAGALDLAVLRVVLAIVLATSGSVAAADHWAALPDAARVAPLGVAWSLTHLPIEPAIVRAVRALLWIACATGAIGLFTRTSFALATLAALYVLLVPQLGGAVFHDHHLLWLAALLAAAPSGDALSIDAWLASRRGSPRPASGRAHGAALRVAWLMVGLIFFFPGVHKLAESGLDWITTDNLRNQLWWKWAMDPALVPTLRIDRHPLLLRVLAALTIAFELAFLPLVLCARTRALAVISALLFHAGAQVFMGIRFGELWACYVMFVPWSALLGRVPRPSLVDPRALHRVAITGAALLTGIVIAGAAGAMQAYPFACYPTFQWIAPDEMPGLAITVEHDDGRLEPLARGWWAEPGPRGWAQEWRLAGVYGPVDRAALAAFWADRTARDPLRTRVRGVTRVQFHRILRSVDPDASPVEHHRIPLGFLDHGRVIPP